MNLEQLKIKLSPVVLIFAIILVLNVSPCSGKTSGDEAPVTVPAGNLLFSYFSQSYEPTFMFNADSVVIPLKRAGRLFLIEAVVDGVEGNLVFDTGAGRLVMNSTYFRNHVRSGNTHTSGITGSAGIVSQITIEKIEFANLQYQNLRADITDLGHIENQRNFKILGLIGFNMMKNLEVVIDARNSELRLYRIDDSGKRTATGKKQFIADHYQEFEVKSDVMFLKAGIGGKTFNFCFDTGAETNVLNSYANKKMLNTITITRRKVLKGAGGGSSEVLFGKMNEFMIGNRNIAGMETIVTNLSALNDVYGKTIDGMLGCSFMDNGIICINFVKKEFSIRYWKGGDQ